MGRTALELGADTFQFFTRNPRGSRAKALDTADAAALSTLLAEKGFAPIVAHAPYILNLCSDKEENRRFAAETMADDLRRLEHIPGQLYNFHPGSHVGQGTERGVELIAQGLNTILRPDQSTTVLLETMAGKGSEVGGRFEELRSILDRVELGEKMGVCLDTCHVHDGGYDIVNDLDGVLTEFDRVIGLERLKAIHLNDSKNPRGAAKDRHECLGRGHIGLEALERIVNHPALRDLPFCLETPNELPGYRAEIELMRSLTK
jgi:deoxyribonuclease-4